MLFAVTFACGIARADPRSAIHGRVVDAVTGDPLIHAAVRVAAATQGEIGGSTTTTDAKGRFSFIGLDDDVVVVVEAPGHGPQSCAYRLSPGGGAVLTFELDTRATNGVPRRCPVAPIGGGQTQDVYILR